MLSRLLRNICDKFITFKAKITPKNVNDEHKLTNEDYSPSSEEIFIDHNGLVKRRSQIGNLITFRTRTTSSMVYPQPHPSEPEEVKEEPIDVNNIDKCYTIKVKIDVIKWEENQEIVKKYNEIKPSNWPPLAILERAEGGFQIEIPEKKNMKCANMNDKIKQLRWMNKALVCDRHYPTFNHLELQLLFRSMHSVLGDNVYLE